jgi:hypothetical protein
MTSQGSGAWMMSRGLDETERGRTKRRSTGGLRRLSFGFGFERGKAWTGCDGPWAVIFVLVGSFAVKMGYPVLLVLDRINHNNMKTNHQEKSKESITMETHDFSPEVHVLAGTLRPHCVDHHFVVRQLIGNLKPSSPRAPQEPTVSEVTQ